MSKKPFFARFLETQELAKVTGNAPASTGRGRSHNDELIAVTLKYPSDGEETGVEPIFVTEKYPSDSDEGGVM